MGVRCAFGIAVLLAVVFGGAQSSASPHQPEDVLEATIRIHDYAQIPTESMARSLLKNVLPTGIGVVSVASTLANRAATRGRPRVAQCVRHARRVPHAGTALSVTSRRILKAALANRKSQFTLARPRSFTLRIQAIVFSQPNAGSIRGRACRLFA
jgi:hypothetical protein